MADVKLYNIIAKFREPGIGDGQPTYSKVTLNLGVKETFRDQKEVVRNISVSKT
jgi:hypothetical protein